MGFKCWSYNAPVVYISCLILWILSSISDHIKYPFISEHHIYYLILRRCFKWLLRYFNLEFWGHILNVLAFRFSSIPVDRYLTLVYTLGIGPLRLSFEFVENQINGCLEIQIFVFWVHLLFWLYSRLSSIGGSLSLTLADY